LLVLGTALGELEWNGNQHPSKERGMGYKYPTQPKLAVIAVGNRSDRIPKPVRPVYELY
jgi:hypothetical protein